MASGAGAAASLFLAILMISGYASADSMSPAGSMSNYYNDFTVTWGDGRGNIDGAGDMITLTLDETSGSGFESYASYLYTRIDIKIKLVAGNSAGTVTTFYLLSSGDWSTHDEIDFEFLGNVSGQPITIHTNVFASGKGNREMQFYPWFDPTADYHTYTILWNPVNIIFMVDETPIRVFTNYESKGIEYPTSKPMKAYASLWDAEDWATRGGMVKTDWSQAPFKASYGTYSIADCNNSGDCSGNSGWYGQTLDTAGMEKMEWAQKNYMVYNYCTDYGRFQSTGFPPECAMATAPAATN